MEIKWLEDFVCLADTRSYPRAAGQRRCSQSAFNRRIQALESWLGTELLDRRSASPVLTHSARAFQGLAERLIQDVYEARNQLRGTPQVARNEIRCVMPACLATHFFPSWFTQIREQVGGVTIRVDEMSTAKGAASLAAGDADFLICHHHAQSPACADLASNPFVSLGKEWIRPYSACDEDGFPVYRLPGGEARPIPLLSCGDGEFPEQLVDLILLKAPTAFRFKYGYQSQLLEALKRMVVAGHGVAWLPDCAVRAELKDEAIAPAGPDSWAVQLPIRMYRTAKKTPPAVDAVWDLFTASRRAAALACTA